MKKLSFWWTNSYHVQIYEWLVLNILPRINGGLHEFEKWFFLKTCLIAHLQWSKPCNPKCIFVNLIWDTKIGIIRRTKFVTSGNLRRRRRIRVNPFNCEEFPIDKSLYNSVPTTKDENLRRFHLLKRKFADRMGRGKLRCCEAKKNSNVIALPFAFCK